MTIEEIKPHMNQVRRIITKNGVIIGSIDYANESDTSVNIYENIRNVNIDDILEILDK